MNPDGDIVVHRTMHAAPEPFLTAVAPSRAGLVVAVAWLFAWYGRAALWPPEGSPVVRGHALSRTALPGGKAKHDTSDSHKMAALLRGGMRPQAEVSPAERRAPRARLRRRMPLMRPRAALLAHIHQTTRQDTLPERGTKRASQANRAGGAARLPAPAVPPGGGPRPD